MVARLRNHRKVLEKAIELSVPLAVGLSFLGAFRWLLSDLPTASVVTVGVLQKFGVWLALLLGAVFVSLRAGQWLAKKGEYELAALRTGAVSFAFTSGDENDHLTQVAASKKGLRRFFFASAWALIINVVAAYVAFRLGIGSN
jgi:hypothetical protein